MITEEQAIAIAKEECARRGWLWNPAMKIMTKANWDFWKVFTPGKGMGMALQIDKETGKIIHAGRWPR